MYTTIALTQAKSYISQLPAAVVLDSTDIGVYCGLVRSSPTYALSLSEPEQLPRLKQRPLTSLPPRHVSL